MTQLSICNEALVLIGAGKIASLAGNDARAIASSTLYTPALEETLAAHRWRFASAAAVMTRDGAAPDTRWEASYALPAGVHVVHGVFVQDQPIAFDRFADKIHCNAAATDTVIVEVTTAVSDTLWPAYFSACVRLKLAAQFALAIAADANMASVFEGKFVRQMAQARLLDSQGRTAAKMPVGRLAAFVSGGRGGYLRIQEP